jgi:hypothetical protein
MFFYDQNPPRFHAWYGRAKCLVRISDSEVIAGELPPTARTMVKEWALSRRAELEQNWARAHSGQPLERIAGPDGQG